MRKAIRLLAVVGVLMMLAAPEVLPQEQPMVPDGETFCHKGFLFKDWDGKIIGCGGYDEGGNCLYCYTTVVVNGRTP
jgi:hypothetical protein